MKENLFRLFLVTAILASFSAYAESSKKSSDIKYPDPQRFADKIKEYQQWDRKNACPKDAVLFVGSSSIVFWNTADSFPDLPVINRGFGGSYTAEALYYVNDLVIKYKPRVVIVYEGDNDIAGAVPPQSVHKDFIALADAIHTALPDTEIICLAAKLCRIRWKWQAEINELNELNKAYSKLKHYITFVDTASILLGTDRLPKEDYFLSDQLHLNDKGYARWNSLLAPVIKERYSVALKKSDKQ
jgi:lysophospholipase L1-like esterase